MEYNMSLAIPIGSGAFGQVLMAKNIRENKNYAIKFLTTPHYDVHRSQLGEFTVYLRFLK